MPNRYIKESIWTSSNLNEASDLSERHFYRLLPLVDDHGCCDITPLVIKGRCYPLKEKITKEMIEKWTSELEAVDILRTWKVGSRVFAWFPKWSEHQRIREEHKRRTPEPPPEVLNSRESPPVAADCGLIPIPPPIPIPTPNPPNPPSPPSGGRVSGFDIFYEAYQKKENKGQARKTWDKLKPSPELLQLMLKAIERAKKSKKWLKNDGEFIPNASTWLNAEGWLDEYDVAIQAPAPTTPKWTPPPEPTEEERQAGLAIARQSREKLFGADPPADEARNKATYAELQKQIAARLSVPSVTSEEIAAERMGA